MTDEQGAGHTGGGAEGAFGLPEFDFEALLQRMNLAGLNVSGLLESERRNLLALREANEALIEGWQELAEQQRGIFEDGMRQWQEALGRGFPGNAEEFNRAMTEQAELGRAAVEQTLANMRTLAEISARSQGKAMEVIRRRIEERLAEFTGSQSG